MEGRSSGSASVGLLISHPAGMSRELSCWWSNLGEDYAKRSDSRTGHKLTGQPDSEVLLCWLVTLLFRS